MNEKQKLFCEEYLVDLNATQAAIRAGYSQDTAGASGFQLLKNTEIKSYIRAARNRLIAKTQVVQENVLAELSRIAFSDPADLFDSDGQLLSVRQMPKRVRQAVQSIKISRKKEGDEVVETKEIRFWPKVTALENLAEHLGLFQKRKEETGTTVNILQVNVGELHDSQLEQLASILGGSVPRRMGEIAPTGRNGTLQT